MVECELCGKGFMEGFKVKVEGSLVNSCAACASIGVVVSEVSDRGKPKLKSAAVEVQSAQAVKHAVLIEVPDEPELVEDYGGVIRRAREKRGLKQKDFGRLINEPESLVHRIESGHIPPSPSVAAKIIKALGVRLYASSKDEDKPQGGKGQIPKDVTLGDLVVIRRKGDKQK
ncbi:Helix-turn-helix [uncultured archaeon]|nr:Helix-turn-helix [uncultured archaeon]